MSGQAGVERGRILACSHNPWIGSAIEGVRVWGRVGNGRSGLD